MRVLIVEDERDMNRIIAKKLQAEGYSTDCCFDGEDGLYHMETTAYDAVVLDVMLPKLDGFALLSKARSKGITTPVIFLTARDSIADRVNGLNLGGNDYLVKPFSFEELVARIRAMTRTQGGHLTNRLQVADLEMDCSACTVSRGGIPITLSAKEYAMLEYLMYNAGVVLSRETIEHHIWNYDYDGGSNVVDVYIRYLRKKIDVGHGCKLIHTVRGRGYVIRKEG